MISNTHQHTERVSFARYINDVTGYKIESLKEFKNINKNTNESKRFNNQNINVIKLMYEQQSKLKNHMEELIISPDDKRLLLITQSSNSSRSSAYVTIQFLSNSGVIYGCTEIDTSLKAFWKENNTIVIVTSKKAITNTQYREVRSFQDIIKIEYIEV